MVSKLHFYNFLSICFIFSTSLYATDYTVSSVNEFEALNLQPCDVVTWTNGTYSDQEIVFNAIGESGSPIVLKAETPGGVIFTGESKLNIHGEYLIVDGFYWNGGIGFNNHVEFRRSGGNDAADGDFANNCIMRNCAFNDLQVEDPTEPDAKSRWIVLYGSNNTIENCSFLNKDTTGVCILVELLYAAGASVSHNISNNYFFNVTPKDGRLNSGDSEGIRIGTSSYQTINADVTVEGNYFKEVDGENEIISNKSLGNTYRNNTFRKCRGSLVLRHGAQALVEGNYFIGENKANSGGIRVSDQDHVIINNYMQGLDNSSSAYNNGITLMGGNTSSGGTSSGYQNVSNVLIAFNTIYNSDDPIFFNDLQGSTDPQVTVANNCIYSTNGTLISGAISNIGGAMTYSGNIFGGSIVGITDPGIIEDNANFSPFGEVYKPSTTGPVPDASVGTYNEVAIDIEGYTRPASGKDVGAHEVVGNTGTATNSAPITDADVGNSIGVCYLNAAGMSSGTACVPVDYGTNCAPIPVTGVSVSPQNGLLGVGDTLQLSAAITPNNATNIQVIWSTNDMSIATVDANGLVTATGEGIAIITVTTDDGAFMDSASIEVLPPLSPPDCVMDENLSLIATVVSFSDQQSTNPASNVIDGDSDNRWSAETFPQNMVIDLGASYYVGGINLYPYQGRDYQYLVEGSSTSSTSDFTTLVDRTSNTAGSTVISDSFSFETVRYIRLTVTGAATYTGPWCSISDMEVVCAGANLSIPEDSLEAQIKIFPNPFNDELHLSIPIELSSSVKGLRLLDSTGKLLLETQETTLKIENKLSNGLYFVQVLGNKNQVVLTRKVIKN
ncbi:chondroitinase-B domain-containing protein [Winogradskyella flava]|uniref:chondroitinase-B domain-containing protein n=1 Tax=Winogradskyella flava TaxID=1884876 RepID=UPI002490C0F0|nr:chondroitinase-B domain-containing protein [Winogradskyella flava]